MNDKKSYWDNVYQSKEVSNCSWYQPKPETSLSFVIKNKIPKTAKIIDVGGGNGFFVDHLLKLGYTNITVLDISEVAIKKAQKRLGNLAENVNWIVGDACDFKTTGDFDLWHDRAAFHFLTQEEDIQKYVQNANKYISPEGMMAIGTFSMQGPKKCSGLEITQYSEKELAEIFSEYFEVQNSFYEDHKTPFDTIQNFVFGSFKKK